MITGFAFAYDGTRSLSRIALRIDSKLYPHALAASGRGSANLKGC